MITWSVNFVFIVFLDLRTGGMYIYIVSTIVSAGYVRRVRAKMSVSLVGNNVLFLYDSCNYYCWKFQTNL